MSEHTAGPWVSLYPEAFQVDAPGARTRIASLPHSVSDQQEANARLIAAAPTMREYIERKAEDGDAEARAILETIDA